MRFKPTTHLLALPLGAALLASSIMPAAQAQLLTLQGLADGLLDLDAQITINTGDISALGGQLSTVTGAVAGLTTDVTATTAAVATLATDVAANAAAAADLDLRVDVLGATVSANAGAQAALSADVAAQASATAALTADVDANAAAIAGLGVQLGQTDGNVTNLTNVVSDITNTVADHTATLLDHDTRITANAAGVADLSVQLGQTNGNVTNLTNVVSNITNTVTDHTTLLANHETRIVANTADLLALDNRVTINANALVATNLQVQALAEGRLGLVRQDGPDGAVTVAAATGGEQVVFTGSDGDRRLSGVAAGVASNDAATVGQLAAIGNDMLGQSIAYTDQTAVQMLGQANAYTDNAVARSAAILRREMDGVAASSAALAGLPQSIVPGQGMIGAGVGGRGDAMAMAVGLSKAFRGRYMPVVKAGAAYDARAGNVSYNAAVGLHF